MKERQGLFSRYSDKPIIFAALFLVIYGSFMIMSASMPYATGSTSIIISTLISQSVFAVIALIAFAFLARFPLLPIRRELYWMAYYVLLFLLLFCRVFSPVGGAYAWIRLGPISVQPSEFAKIFMILFGARILSADQGARNLENLKSFAIAAMVYILIIIGIQKDLGSAVVLFVICYCIVLIPPHKQYRVIQRVMVLLVFVAIAGVIFLLSPVGTEILRKLSSGSYKIARFLASANPFLYLYDDGYHLVMSLVSFATGGLFGLGYGNSIHKYMNFPSPTTDFILPVIVEELGLVFGLIPVLAGYFCILFPLRRYSLLSKRTASKMVLLGVYMYYMVHFFFNVGGVSGLIPLTGVPLLLLSSGGSSLLAAMMSLGIAEAEIIRYRKENDENHRGKV